MNTSSAAGGSVPRRIDLDWIRHRCAYLRSQKGLSARRMSAEMEVAESFVTNFENGEKGISVERLLEMIAALDVSPSAFFRTEEDSEIFLRLPTYLRALPPQKWQAILDLLGAEIGAQGTP